MRTDRPREWSTVLLFAGLVSGLSLGKSWHIDEPCFLAMARHALAHPLRPLDFLYNWDGYARRMATINPNPPLAAYLTAFALAVGGAGEWAARLALMPFDLLAAAALYCLARRFLKNPLLPTLVVLAGPLWAINMPLIMAEKWVMAFGLSSLALLTAAPERRGRFWASAAMLALALLTKLSAVFFLAPALAWSWRKGARPRRLLGFFLVAIGPAAAAMLWDGSGRLAGLWRHTLGFPQGGLDRMQSLRALLAFTGGCLLPSAVWPLLGRRSRPSVAVVAVAAEALILLYSPAFDVEPVRAIDRLCGVAFAGAALILFAEAAHPLAADEGALLWRPWIAAAAFLQLFVYWSVASRFVLFLAAPLTFSAAAALEKRLPAARVRRAELAGLAAAAALSFALGFVDWRHAEAQEVAARHAVEWRRLSGGRIWFTGHWGLQEYMEAAGARGIDVSAGGWDLVRSGDLVVVPTTNSYMVMPKKPFPGRTTRLQIDSSVPLRLMRGWGGTASAGFYSSVFGFLPYAFSLEPIERFRLVEKF